MEGTMIFFDIENADSRWYFEQHYRKLMESASPDFQAAMLAGCEIEYSSEVTPEGIKITGRTKNPVAVVRDAGQVTVYEAPHGQR
jgi:hypothetical protein